MADADVNSIHLDLHLKRLGDIIVSDIEAINIANRFRGEGT